ncbi:hypothetical protein GOP47_0011202 [Adiantum capillus-veneris]|uniref:Uncharacterized protein n=1 Tax=Adiantum capillus-veneris TaxID=13818 RepID=A0A9D4USB4_ADICA|nr:hypothetical protein GOP47_0011202 [Adiantum capillus-veneris]
MAQRLQTVGSHIRLWASSSSPSCRACQKRGLHIPPGEREKALLEEDPALKHYKSTKGTAQKVKLFGDVLVIIVSAGCCYQVYDVTKKRRAERLGQTES